MADPVTKKKNHKQQEHMLNDPCNQAEFICDYIAGQGPQEVDLSAAVKQQAFQAMKELEGWCSQHKAGILIDLILAMKPQTIVEIGVFGGKSLVPMAYALRANNKGIAFGIDPWSNIQSIQGMDGVNKDWWYSVDHIAIMNGLIQKIGKFNLQNYITLIKSTSENAEPIFDIDLLHIDGNHSTETSYLDVTKWAPLVKKGGIIILDDVTWGEIGHPTQQKSVLWLDEHCEKQAQFTDEAEWAIWIKK